MPDTISVVLPDSFDASLRNIPEYARVVITHEIRQQFVAVLLAAVMEQNGFPEMAQEFTKLNEDKDAVVYPALH